MILAIRMKSTKNLPYNFLQLQHYHKYYHDRILLIFKLYIGIYSIIIVLRSEYINESTLVLWCMYGDIVSSIHESFQEFE